MLCGVRVFVVQPQGRGGWRGGGGGGGPRAGGVLGGHWGEAGLPQGEGGRRFRIRRDMAEFNTMCCHCACGLCGSPWMTCSTGWSGPLMLPSILAYVHPRIHVSGTRHGAQGPPALRGEQRHGLAPRGRGRRLQPGAYVIRRHGVDCMQHLPGCPRLHVHHTFLACYVVLRVLTCGVWSRRTWWTTTL
jgi:hypothetical protein